MWERIKEMLGAAMLRMSDNVADFIPGLAGLLVIVALAVILAVLVRLVLARLLSGLRLDQRAENLGLGSAADWSVVGGLSVFVARVAMWTVIVAGVLVGLSALDAALPEAFARSIFGYVPNILAALLILVVGTVLSCFFARSVLIGAVNLRLELARPLSLGIKWLVILLAWTIALEHLGIGRGILAVSFATLLAGIVLASALAVGLGSTEWVREAIAKRRGRAGHQPDDLPHV
jgi:hypothetical protein